MLRLDELAYLIEKSVVGNSRLSDFSSKTGSVVWKEWEELKNRSDADALKLLRKGEKVLSEYPTKNLDQSLQEFARTKFEIDNEASRD
ncbi:hypothetical protein [Candidatus Villigracilis affinis]|uniref:hypothetical protein n=1 Tax=Candidatus Villigracilis affinis TaxID=3140682 RepID=UPI002A1D431E|nr:hypothetical protein [Anaerolineales bacterium]